MKNNLTPAAAIIELNNLKNNSVVGDAERRNAAVNIAIKAINRCMINQKPKPEGNDEQDFYICPACTNPLCAIDETYLEDEINFCDFCGQALDWGRS